MATSSTSKTRKIPAEYTPISMWGYFGYQILFSIPLIGWIIVIVFAITAPNQNDRACFGFTEQGFFSEVFGTIIHLKPACDVQQSACQFGKIDGRSNDDVVAFL